MTNYEDAGQENGPKRHFAFLLLPDFPLLSYASAVEPLRAANQLSGKLLYEWSHVSTSGTSIRASSGVLIPADHQVGDDVNFDMLFVCAGDPAAFHEPATLNWLRRVERRGTQIAGMSAGVFVLARAGLLDGFRCTIHWEHIPAMEEEFANLSVRRTLFEIDRGRVTCAGGIASLDMMLAIIERVHGRNLVVKISEWFLRTQPRPGHNPQRMTLHDRYGVTHPKLLKALELIETHIEEPLSSATIAAEIDTSVRHLQRLFVSYLGTKLNAHYLGKRLERGNALLTQTALSVSEVAIACGFVSPNHFSRTYREKFGRSPLAERKARRRAAAALPEQRQLLTAATAR